MMYRPSLARDDRFVYRESRELRGDNPIARVHQRLYVVECGFFCFSQKKIVTSYILWLCTKCENLMNDE